ncbi:MAG: amidohydrolase family protein [Chloroflexi bacterium]|nr:amidohydrolase family protein [Chloroflexota bacterium]
MTAKRIDTHQHFWNLAKVEYPWLRPQHGVIYNTFAPRQLEPHLQAVGIDKTVLVQSANSFEDTVSMLTQAEDYDWIGAVVGWIPLLEPDNTRKALERYSRHPKFRGIRHLIHDEPDPDWVIQPTAVEGLKVLAELNMSFDVVAVYPNHLKHVPVLAEKIPNLTLIIDHLAKPPIKDRQMGAWADQMAAAAQYPNVCAKVSGLNTAADWDNWSATDLKPYIDFVIEKFGADRLMFGSDWPVCLLAGDYAKVWAETNAALAGRSPSEIEAILGGTAERVYKL